MSTLSNLRKKIDEADRKIVKILGERFFLTKIVGEYKKIHKLKPYDKKREDDMMTERAEWAIKAGLDKDFIKKLFKNITAEVKKKHKKIISNK